jgi:hypothetical protein
MHRRNFPQKYRFDYRVFSFLVDIDQLDEAIKKSPLLSLNRLNLYSIYTKDHGARDGSDWRSWINAMLDQAGISRAKHQIKLLCFPRVLGYAFNPLCLWYCYGDDQQLYAIICEVRNTFGEHHHYLLHNKNHPYEDNVTAYKNKHFHVSPFISMEAEYQFILESPDQKLSIVINEYQNQELMLTATQLGQRQTVNSSQLLLQFLRIPVLSIKVMTLIHWQALKIWFRGGKFHKKPSAPERDFS